MIPRSLPSTQGVHRQRHLKRRIRRIADDEDEDLLGAQGMTRRVIGDMTNM